MKLKSKFKQQNLVLSLNTASVLLNNASLTC